MGFSLKKVFSNITKTIQTVSNPVKMAQMKYDLMKPSDKPTLNNVFKKLDPVLDTLDPMHNEVQKATTGQSTTAGQSPYFQKIAPMIVNAFFPGVGSAAAAVSDAAEGNTKGALINTAGAAVGYYGYYGGGTQVLGVDGKVIGGIISTGVNAYRVVDAFGNTKAEYSEKPQVKIQPNYAPSSAPIVGGSMAYIPSVAAADQNAAQNVAIAEMQADNKQKTLLVLAVIAGVYIFSKGKK